MTWRCCFLPTSVAGASETDRQGSTVPPDLVISPEFSSALVLGEINLLWFLDSGCLRCFEATSTLDIPIMARG
jgi:hypothetical protein